MPQLLSFILPHIFITLLYITLLVFIIRIQKARLHWSPAVIIIGIITVIMSSSFTVWFQYKQINSLDFSAELFSKRLMIFGFLSALGFIIQTIGYAGFFHFIYKRREYLRNVPPNPDSGFHEAIKNENDIID